MDNKELLDNLTTDREWAPAKERETPSSGQAESAAGVAWRAS